MKTFDTLVGTLIASTLCTLVGCAPEGDVEESDERAALAQEAEAIDLSGSWGVAMTTPSEMTAPLIGKSASTAALALRLHVYKEQAQYRADVEICRLSTDSATVKLDYVNVVPLMKTSVPMPLFEPAIGGEVPLPDLVFRVGQDEAGVAVDADGDGRPGVTVPTVALGLLSMKAYTGFELKVGLDAVLKDAETIQGTYSFGAVGRVFGSSSPLLPPGELRVAQTLPNATYTARRFEGELSCAELMRRL